MNTHQTANTTSAKDIGEAILGSLAKKKELQINVTPFLKSPLTGSNRRPTDYKSVALPAELRRRFL